MALVFDDGRLKLREFPDPMAKRFGIDAAKCLAAPAALGRHARHNVLALFSGDQCPFMFVVAELCAAGPFGFWFVGYRLGVRVYGGRRQGRIGRVPAAALEFSEFRFQFSKVRGQPLDLPRLPLNQGKDFRRQRSQDIRRNKGWCIHAA